MSPGPETENVPSRLVRIIRNWDWDGLNLLRQTPGGRGIWENIRFTVDETEACDYAVVLNRPRKDVTVRCPPGHVWAIIQEPPNEVFRPLHRGQRCFHRVFTQDPSLAAPRYVQAPPAVPWFVKKSYDELKQCFVPDKPHDISCIASTNFWFHGHRERLQFIERLRRQLSFDLYGYGFHAVSDKWDALAPYRYTLVIENFRNPFYWSEKLADAFLSWTMPIYIGCTRIADYFPKAAFIPIEMDDVATAAKAIKEAIASDAWGRNLEAIKEARNLILDRYQLFPFLCREIGQFETSGSNPASAPRPIKIKAVTASYLEMWVRSKITTTLVNVQRRLFQRQASSIQRGGD